ncbi:MAG: ArnT family glycosyltransferase [Streptosporangiaceae bacterium]
MALEAPSPGREPADGLPPDRDRAAPGPGGDEARPGRSGSAGSAGTATLTRPRRGRRRASRSFRFPWPAAWEARAAQRGTGRSYPLLAICLVQAVIGLTLVGANTAFTDEADYLWIGHLVIGHWLHGTSWPAGYAHRVLSGSAVIYPPLGAAADGLAGLAGARTLSLAFMVGATVLIYLTGTRLLGRAEAVIAAALWAFSAPALRLVFATYDPMSVFLAALSGWLAVRSAASRRPVPFIVACGVALGLADATAYSGLVIAPVVIAFAVLLWRPRLGPRRAWACTGWLAISWLASFGLLITVSGSWAGIAFTVINRKVADYQQPSVIVTSIALYSWFVLITALLGAVIGIRERDRKKAALLVFLGLTALVVPAAQLIEGTAWAMDKHLAYGIWFAVLASAYGCRAIAGWLGRALHDRRGLVALAGVIVLAFPMIANCQLARQTLQGWANASAFIAAFRPVAARTGGPIFASAQQRVAEYYTPQGSQWGRWKTWDLSLKPAGLDRGRWYSYYAGELRASHAGVIALFYAPPSAAGRAARDGWLDAHRGHMYGALRTLANFQRSEPGVPALTRAIERDRQYRLVAVGPYDSGAQSGIFAIWRLS